MKIDSHSIELASSRVYEEKKQEMEELREWGKKAGDSRKTENNSPQLQVIADRVSLSMEAREAYSMSIEQSSISMSSGNIAEQITTEDLEDGIDPRLLTLKRMIEYFTGKEIRISKFDSSAPEQPAYDNKDVQNTAQTQEAQGPSQSTEQLWGMRYVHYESYYESEQTSFSAQGLVRTADGKEIAFSLDLAMSREYFREESLEIRAGAALVDPLVINYAGTAAELTDMKFEFDLNMDGEKETLRQLAPGSGFLVFDRNKDGVVNDGSELFGAKTGNGFQELAAYDDDKNNWIDENDAIYKDLYLWRHENGRDYLTDLKSANVGAIYLGNEQTQFALKDSSNELLAQVQRTGVYLKEDGGVGTVQQVDFSV